MSDPNIPSVPGSFAPDQQPFVQALKLCLEILLGQGRNPEATRALRVEEYTEGMSNIVLPVSPTNPVTGSEDPPDPPTNLIVTVGLWHHELSWDIPADVDGLISHIEIWAAIGSQLRDDANLVGIVTVTPGMRGGKGYFTYSDFSISDDVTYWIRSISYANNHSPWCPPDDQGGYVVIGAETLPGLISEILELLAGQITAVQLHDLLNSEIEKISGSEVGSVNARILAADARLEAVRSGIQSQIDEISSIEEYDPEKPYLVDDLVKYESKLYQCNADTIAGTLPTDTAFWSVVGDVSSLGEAVGNNSSDILAINYVDVNSTSAAARSLASMVSKIDDPDTGLEKAYAKILEETQTRTNADLAFAGRSETLEASFNNPGTGLSTTVADIVTNHAMLAKDVGVWASATDANIKVTNDLVATVGLNVGAIGALQDILITEDGGYVWDSSDLTLRIGATEGIISKLQHIVIDPNAETYVVDTTDLELRIDGIDGTGGAISRIDKILSGETEGTFAWSQEIITVYDGPTKIQFESLVEIVQGVSGNYTIKINNAGAICGFGLLSTMEGDTPTSAFEIQADTFTLSYPGAPDKKPFTVGEIDGDTAVGISGDLFVDGTVLTNVLYAGKLMLDSTDSPSAAFEIPTGYWGNRTGHFACMSRTSELGFVCQNSNSGEGSAIFGYCSDLYQLGAGVAGYNKSTRIDESYGGYFLADWGYGLVGETGNPYNYGLYTPNKAYIAGGVYPFTGAHIVYTNDLTLQIGQIVYAVDSWCFNINQNLILVLKTTIPNDKRVAGVISEGYQPLMTNIEKNVMVSEKNEDSGEWTVKPEYQPYIDMLVSGGYQQVCINAVGEGGLLVCSDNGDIDNGDYLCSANLPGHAMRQSDDILHNYTVGKALEAVIWANEPSTTKLIACTYHCG